jgi:uncharacterized protein
MQTMMTGNKYQRDDILRGITSRIADAFHPRRIVLFGSRARGEARPGSDYDIFVEMETDLRPVERAARIDELFGWRDWSMDLVVYTPDEAKRCVRNAGFIMDEIEKEGVVLYEEG